MKNKKLNKKEFKPLSNEHILRKLYNILILSEAYALTNNTTRYHYLNMIKNKYIGVLRKEIDRILDLGKDAEIFIENFITIMIKDSEENEERI